MKWLKRSWLSKKKVKTPSPLEFVLLSPENQRVPTCGWTVEGQYICVHVSGAAYVKYLEIRLVGVVILRHDFQTSMKSFQICVCNGDMFKLYIPNLFPEE